MKQKVKDAFKFAQDKVGTELLVIAPLTIIEGVVTGAVPAILNSAKLFGTIKGVNYAYDHSISSKITAKFGAESNIVKYSPAGLAFVADTAVNSVLSGFSNFAHKATTSGTKDHPWLNKTPEFKFVVPTLLNAAKIALIAGIDNRFLDKYFASDDESALSSDEMINNTFLETEEIA